MQSFLLFECFSGFLALLCREEIVKASFFFYKTKKWVNNINTLAAVALQSHFECVWSDFIGGICQGYQAPRSSYWIVPSNMGISSLQTSSLGTLLSIFFLLFLLLFVFRKYTKKIGWQNGKSFGRQISMPPEMAPHVAPLNEGMVTERAFMIPLICVSFPMSGEWAGVSQNNLTYLTLHWLLSILANNGNTIFIKSQVGSSW